MRAVAVPMVFLAAMATSAGAEEPKPGDRLDRHHDEIVVGGELYHTTAPVVLWFDPGGCDAYRLDRPEGAREPADEKETPRLRPRFGRRNSRLAPEQAERVRERGWDLPALQSVVDQFVIHFDAVGTSRGCFDVLNRRGLSVHFMLDLDGTIYQTLDLQEAAWHATVANGRSVGIEIANIGAYPAGERGPLDRWYRRDEDGRARVTLPEGAGPLRRGGDWVPRPIRDEPVVGTVQGQELRQYDLTPEQYDSLIRLTATLCTLFPKIACDYPRDASGALIPKELPDAEYKGYHGLLGHYHVQDNKVDPGPAFQWDRLIDGARKRMGPKEDGAAKGQREESRGKREDDR